jgi:hypothetical protein
MATSSILGGKRAPSQAEGRDVGALGPSDTSDSGSDVQGELDLGPDEGFDNAQYGNVQPGLGSDTDSTGTGERGAARRDEESHQGEDISPDQIRSLADEAESMSGATNAELDFVELSDLDELAAEDREREEDGDGVEQTDDSPR